MTMTRRSVLLLGWGAIAASATAATRRERKRRQRIATRAEIAVVIRDCETRTDAFRGQIDRALDRSRLDGTKREDQVNKAARRLEDELDQVKREFEKHENYLDIRANVDRALAAARDIDLTMRRQQLGPDAERAWRVLRDELNILADHYNTLGVK
ncbi:MAG: hypothetical protein MUF51_05185 [Vicinamibacteria bacterium]|jgi:hypothetical protein|nr:hypothetical protein [Vicinamibacteria bacterium]